MVISVTINLHHTALSLTGTSNSMSWNIFGYFSSDLKRLFSWLFVASYKELSGTMSDTHGHRLTSLVSLTGAVRIVSYMTSFTMSLAVTLLTTIFPKVRTPHRRAWGIFIYSVNWWVVFFGCLDVFLQKTSWLQDLWMLFLVCRYIIRISRSRSGISAI